jgi:hypothetical protein
MRSACPFGAIGDILLQHVQAIIVSIDQYAEAALGNRNYFLNKPHGVGGTGDNIP